ncbi:TPA: hypothetical protein N0F65_012591 [Lagenidium giganteum]|uniref:Glucanase n=1 Tax=Lagenidium giganteum TaxID=4803 RepID=A0AAV2YSM3_9STRA|nr:TPA: hypothetical protein N0F65_012591 [Lagenidium giganteum]
MIESEGVVTWYSDNKSKSEMMPALERMVKTCSKEERIAIAVYGIPNKDCDAKLSDAGRNKNMDDYKTFIQELKDVIKDRNVLYVLEPDAIGLMPKGGCGSSNGYLEYLQYAATALSENANAQIYLDVGYWIVGANGKVKGIVLNTSNYRQTKEMSEVCAAFKKDLGKDLKCVVDTSRNGNGAPGDEWCNAKNTAIGQPPSKPSGFDNVAYNLYVKPPGESDGECTNRNETAGQFFKEHFTQLWNNGYFVKEKGAKKLE